MEECCICLDELETDIVVLNCLHKIHYKCLLKSRRYTEECPLCRSSIDIVGYVDSGYDVKGNIIYMQQKRKRKNDSKNVKMCTLL